MKKFLVLVALCLTTFSCRHSSESDNFKDIVIVEYWYGYGLLVALNVKNETKGDVNVDFFPLRKTYENQWYMPLLEDSVKEKRRGFIFSARSEEVGAESESELLFGKCENYSCVGAGDRPPQNNSYIFYIEDKAFAGPPAGDTVVVSEAGAGVKDPITLAEENSGIGLVECYDKFGGAMTSKYGEFSSEKDIPVVHYNVVITDENVDFSFDRVDFVDANEIPSEYWN